MFPFMLQAKTKTGKILESRFVADTLNELYEIFEWVSRGGLQDLDLEPKLKIVEIRLVMEKEEHDAILINYRTRLPMPSQN